MPRISCTCDCSFSSFRHLNFHSGFEPICSYSSVQKSSKVPCFFSFFLFYLALLLLYLFPVSLPPLFLFPVTVTGCKTGVRLPENAEISTFFNSAQANDRNHPVPYKSAVKSHVCLVSFCSILLSLYYIYFLCPFRDFSVSSDGYGLQDRSSTPWKCRDFHFLLQCSGKR
jgi:hypothetical protein